MHVKIGIFNKLPVYLNITKAIELGKQIANRDSPIAYVQPKFIYYDQIRSKYEGSIKIISENEYPKDNRFISSITSIDEIVVNPIFLLLPKIKKRFILWHEYGHFISTLHDERENESTFHDVYEAIADFYACCKLKLHFNTYMKIRYSSLLLERICFKRKKYKKCCLIYEKRYNKLYFSKEIPLNERVQADYVYEFYRDKNRLIDWYKLCFNEACFMDYQNYFDWDNFLSESGWDYDEERWKYISYIN